MILPTKHIPENEALIGLGAIVLENLRYPQAVSALWEKVRDNQCIGTFERFVLSLDLLYILGAIELSDDIIRMVRK